MGYATRPLYSKPSVLTGREYVVLLRDVRCRLDCAKTFYVFERAVLECRERIGYLLYIFVGKIAVFAVKIGYDIWEISALWAGLYKVWEESSKSVVYYGWNT
mgnify:CR=1 FL=1